MLGLTLLPFYYSPEVVQHRIQEAGDPSEAFSFIPFTSTISTFEQSTKFGMDIIFKLVGGNIILLFPLGIYAPILWRNLRTWKRALLVGLVGSMMIESLQFLLGYSTGYYYRTVDIDDVIYNSLGCLFGYLIYKLIRPQLEQVVKEEVISEEHKKDLVRS